MFCPKCGTQIPENDHYCPTCGEPAFKKTSDPDECDRTAMFEAEDAEFLESVASGIYKGCSMADAARAVKIYCKVYGDENLPQDT